MADPTFRRLEEIFHQALALDPPERPGFLDHACADDPNLRRAVETLLRHDGDADRDDTFLSSPFVQAAPTEIVGGGTPDRVALPAVPGYQLLEEIGRGGMGVVYKALHAGLNRVVALKMMLALGPATPEMLARFRTEAEALARLHHPNIVLIHDVGECGGRPYFTMEYVAGPSLAGRLKGRAQDPAASAWLVETLARAVHAVHECGIIHRDLKPANVLLGPRRGPGTADVPEPAAPNLPLADYEAKLTDFGLAKDMTSGQKLTRTGMTMGTPCYMAPEQAGGPGVIGPATDIYALGAILYEMLTGRPPFEGATTEATIAQLLRDEPISPARLRPGLPRDLVTICLKCLEKTGRRRYAGAWELAEDLRRFQAGEPIRARPVGLVEHAYRWCRRRPLVTSLTALCAVLAAALVTSVVIYQFRLEEAALRESRAHEAEAEAEARAEQQQIVQLHVTLGVTLLEAGENFAALLHFTEALRLDGNSPEQERSHRVRIATTLRQSPRLAQLLTLGGNVLGVTHGPSGGRAITLREGNTLQVWDLRGSGRVLTTQAARGTPVAAIISSDDRFLATALVDGTIQLWDLRAGRLFLLRSGQPKETSRLAFDPGSRVLVCLTAAGQARLWQLTADGPSASPSWQGAAILSDDAQWLLTSDTAGTLQLHQLGQGSLPTGRSPGAALSLIGAGKPTLAAIRQDGRRAALAGADGTLSVWDGGTGRIITRPVALPQGAVQLALSADGGHVAVVGREHNAQIWEVRAGQLLAAWSLPHGMCERAAFAPGGRYLLVSDGAGRCRLWEADTGRPATPFLGYGDRLAFAGLEMDGRHVRTVSRGGLVCSWELPPVLPAFGGPVSSQDIQGTAAAAPAERLPNGIMLSERRPTAGKLQPPRPGDRLAEHMVASPDGRRVAVCDDLRSIRVWDVTAGRSPIPPLHHTGRVLYAAFSADGLRLITASDDRITRLWDVRTGAALAPALVHERPIERVFFPPGDDRAVVVYEGQTATVWDHVPETRPAEDLLDLAELFSGKQMSRTFVSHRLDPDDLHARWKRSQK